LTLNPRETLRTSALANEETLNYPGVANKSKAGGSCAELVTFAGLLWKEEENGESFHQGDTRGIGESKIEKSKI
jgi:hypothetical protein